MYCACCHCVAALTVGRKSSSSGGQWYCGCCQRVCATQAELEAHYLTAQHLAKAHQLAESSVSALRGRWAGSNATVTAASTGTAAAGNTHFSEYLCYSALTQQVDSTRGR